MCLGLCSPPIRTDGCGAADVVVAWAVAAGASPITNAPAIPMPTISRFRFIGTPPFSLTGQLGVVVVRSSSWFTSRDLGYARCVDFPQQRALTEASLPSGQVVRAPISWGFS